MDQQLHNYYSHSLLCPILFTLIRGATSGQVPIPPIFTPCTFPSPIYQPHKFRSSCSTVPHLPFICDLHHQLIHSTTTGIEAAYEKHKSYFSQNNRSTLAIVIVKQLEAPTKTSSIYDDDKYACMLENDCNRLDPEVVTGFVNNVKIFLKVYAWKVYERWFALDEKCSQPNVLALIVLDGLINNARKFTYVRIHSGETRLWYALGIVQNQAQNALVRGRPLQEAVKDLVDDIGHAMREQHELNGEPRDHSVPRWARHAFLICFGLVILALMIEWYIVRRKLGVQKSGSGIKIASGKSKTHLMF